MYQPPSSAKPLDLRGARLKIERAKKHIADLDAQRVAFLGTDPYYGVPKFNAEANCTEYILQSLPVIPDSIPLILGDAVHNLRSALDYVACELVRSVNVEPDKVYFPISDGPEKYEGNSGGQTNGIPPEAKKDIDRMRPYRGGNNSLWAIHKLDIIDKHRLLLTVGMRIGKWSFDLSQTPTMYTLSLSPILKEGHVIGSVPGNAEPDKRMSVTADIAFGEPDGLEGGPIVETLTQLVNMVEAVVSHFGA
jgi:hypothetical protein